MGNEWIDDVWVIGRWMDDGWLKGDGWVDVG